MIPPDYRAPALTEIEGLSGSGRKVWEHLADGETERAARVFDRISEEKQDAIFRKLDEDDRDKLMEGYNQAIERDTPESEEQSQIERQSQSEGKSKGQDHSEGGREISM